MHTEAHRASQQEQVLCPCKVLESWLGTSGAPLGRTGCKVLP